MNKTYTYNKTHYFIRVTFVGIFAIFMLGFGIYYFFKTAALMYLGLIGIASYIIFETFITCANPNTVIISDEGIIFKDNLHEDVYKWDEIKDFNVRQFPRREEVYILINKDDFKLFKGRYWVFCYYFNDKKELYDYLVKKEIEINPNSYKNRNNRSKAEKKK